MDSAKAWWMSKTIWINLVALAGSIVIAAGLDETKWAEISTVVLAVVNLVLRLISKEEITLQKSV